MISPVIERGLNESCSTLQSTTREICGNLVFRHSTFKRRPTSQKAIIEDGGNDGWHIKSDVTMVCSGSMKDLRLT